MCVFCLDVCICALCMECPQRLEEGIGSSGTGVTDGCWPPCGCWERNLCPFQEQLVLSAIEISLWSPRLRNFESGCSLGLLFPFLHSSSSPSIESRCVLPSTGSPPTPATRCLMQCSPLPCACFLGNLTQGWKLQVSGSQ